MSLDSGSRIGPYEVVSLLGAGGMGEVYRARDAKLQRDVAIKILPPAFASDPDRLARFEREAQVLASLNHPNIGAIYGFVDAGSAGAFPAPDPAHVQGVGRIPRGDGAQGPSGSAVPALVLELVEGPTLADRIAQGPIPLDEALPIAKQIADALEAAHEHGVIHRDLKPANIKLRPDGTVKVLDFGLARAIGPADAGPHVGSQSLSPTIMSPAVTQLGVILGMAAYMSPEQARGKAVDRRADIWAFGCVVYEMLSGTAPFAGEDISLTLSKVLQRDVDWSALPPAGRPVVPLLERCLEKDPRRRLRDIGEARLALEPESLRRSTRDAATLSAGPRGIPFPLAAGAVLAAVALTGLVAWTVRPAVTDSTSPPVVRLSVTLPPGERIAAQGGFGGSTWGPLALSPDATQLAYVTGARLVLRAMNSLDVRSPAGSESAQSPFFSPDGQWVAFFGQGQLKKVSVAGGLATPITDAPLGAGGAWAEDGSIYFAPANMTGLFKVSSDGGEPVVVTTLDRGKGEVSHRWPQVLPGNRLLFTVWRGPGWDEMDIHVHDLSTGQRTVLVRGGSTGRYVRTGHLVYVRAGDLTAVPFDVERLAVTGPPVSLGIEVQEQEGALYTVSDSGLLAYISGRGQRERTLIAMTQDGTPEDLGAPIRSYEDVVPSPDGRRLAVTVQGGSWGVWVFDPSRKTETLLTRGSATSQWPAWTPDGMRIIYRGTRNGSRNLYWRRADGTGDEERLTTGELLETPGSVTADGKWLVYTQSHPKTGSDIWRLPLDGSRTPEPMMTSSASEGDPELSPDGRWLAFTSNDSGRDQVYVQPFPGPGERVVVSSDIGVVPRWSRDGRRLSYLQDTTLMEVEVAATPQLRVGSARRVVDMTGRLADFGALPDGRIVAIQQAEPPEPSTQIHVVVNWFEELTERTGAAK